MIENRSPILYKINESSDEKIGCKLMSIEEEIRTSKSNYDGYQGSYDNSSGYSDPKYDAYVILNNKEHYDSYQSSLLYEKCRKIFKISKKRR